MEERLSKLTAELGFIKFQFKEPKIGSSIIIQFSAQDPTKRNESESRKLLLAKLNAHLFRTNWRLTQSDIFYRLGFLSGELRVYDNEDDLLRIAKQIRKREAKKSSNKSINFNQILD